MSINIKFMISQQPSQPSPLMCALLNCSPPVSSDAGEYGQVDNGSQVITRIHNLLLFSPHRPEGFETFLKIYGPGNEKGEMGLGVTKDLESATGKDQ